MRLLTRIATPLILASVALAACQPQAETSPKIFDTVKTSDYFAANASQILCEGNPKFPASKFASMCLKMGVQTFESEQQAGELGIALGKKVAVPFGDSDWNLITDQTDGLFYQKLKTEGCFDRLYVDMDGAEKLNALQEDYPFKVALVLGFYKTREAVCAKT